MLVKLSLFCLPLALKSICIFLMKMSLSKTRANVTALSKISIIKCDLFFQCKLDATLSATM